MTEKFDEIFKIMQDAFPENEYRVYEEQKQLLKVDNYSIKIRKDEFGKIIGFISSWILDGFIFIEHIAVSKENRCEGIGSKILKEYIEEIKLPLLLEVEIGNTDICKRRIMFYERIGFYLNLYTYNQMSLHANSNSIPMYIMSYPKRLDEKDFEKAKKEIHSKVYSRNKETNVN